MQFFLGLRHTRQRSTLAFRMGAARRTEAGGEDLRPLAFYDRLFEEMTRRRWKINAFAEFLDLGSRTLYRWQQTRTGATGEGGPIALPDTETLLSLAARLGWSLDTLLRGVSRAYDAVADRERQRQIDEAVTAALAVRSETEPSSLQVGEVPALPTPVVSSLMEAAVSSHPSSLSALFHYIASLPPTDLAEAKDVLERWRARKLLGPGDPTPPLP